MKSFRFARALNIAKKKLVPPFFLFLAALVAPGHPGCQLGAPEPPGCQLG